MRRKRALNRPEFTAQSWRRGRPSKSGQGDAGARGDKKIIRCCRCNYSSATRRRAWQLFQERYPIIILPVSAQLPFRFGQDQEDKEVVRALLDAQRPVLAIPALGFPSLAVPTGITDGGPVGVQVIAGRFREDVCFAAAEAIEEHASSFTPISPR